MKKASLEKVQARLRQYVASSAKNPVLILQNGAPVAMLIGLDRKQPRHPMKLRTVLKRAWKEYEEHGATSHDQFWEEVAKEVGRL